ncbi:hypothetical protein KAT63_01055 [Candidatus Parcubacteria bacterium]|nr:hypothetical protein [Candidatus Parcubacteria bacterium]
MKNIKQKLFSLLKLKTILAVALIVIIGTILGLTGLVLSNFKNFKTNQVNHGKFSCTSLSQRGAHEELFCYARYGTTFDLTEEWTPDSSCEDIPWGKCFVENISYDEKYIQEEKSRTEGIGCSVKKVRRFKGIKRGYTKINVNSACYSQKYKLIIY